CALPIYLEVLGQLADGRQELALRELAAEDALFDLALDLLVNGFLAAVGDNDAHRHPQSHPSFAGAAAGRGHRFAGEHNVIGVYTQYIHLGGGVKGVRGNEECSCRREQQEVAGRRPVRVGRRRRAVVALHVEHRAMPPFAYPIDANTLRVVVRAGKGQLRSVTAMYGDRYRPLDECESVQLALAGSDGLYDYFQGELRLRPPRFQYAFLLDDSVRPTWFAETGLSTSMPRGGFFAYPYINEADLYDVPGWLVDGVVYQIFPDRFANGNPANDPPGVRPWSDQRPTARSFYGGDLEGIIQRLPHLEELGVTVLYLTPIFLSPSNHKYDTTDYYRVDPHFGDQETLKELVRQCHAR